MSRKLVAQIFSTNQEYIPTKAELYLRPAGDSGESFTISDASDTVIDACNFDLLTQGLNFITVEDTDAEGFTGVGYIRSNLSATLDNAASVSYPIIGADDGKFYLWLRVKNASVNVQLSIAIDNIPFATVDQSAASWTWVSVPIVIFDEVSHNLSISFLSEDTLIDKIVISKSSTPNGVGPDFSTSPYITAIVRLSTVSSNVPNTFYKTLGYKTTKDSIVKENWYAFDLSLLDNSSSPISQDELAVVLSAAGTSNTLYITWDSAATVTNPIATQIDIDGWIASATETMSLRIYSDNPSTTDEYDCSITTPDASLVSENISDFSISSLKGKLNNTAYTPDNTGGQDVQLDIGDKLVNVIIDQSGSNLWNDNTQLRFEFNNQIADVLEAKYPGDVRFNLFEFRGEQAFSFFIPLKQRITENTVAEIIRQHFKDDSDHFSGFRVIRKAGSYSETPIDGEIIFDGYALAALDIDLEQSTDYYYTVYTYDYLYRFSEGIQISTTTNEPILPRGIPWFSGFALLGYDLKADNSTLSLWQTDEGEGHYSYDFGTTSTKLTLENISWIGITESPTGVSGLRFNGVDSRASTPSSTNFSFDLDGEFSIYAWVMPFSSAAQTVLFTNGTSSDLNYAAIIDSGVLKFTLDGTNYYECGTAVPLNEWTHIAITYNNGLLKFYYNGIQKTTINPGTFPSVTYLGESVFTIGYDTAGFSRYSGRLFGKISHISIHSVERTSAEVLTAATPSKGTDDNGNPQPVDNGDRTVVLEFAVPDDYDYNLVRIIRNPTNQPNHETDGTVVYEEAASAGRFTVSVSYPYDVTEKYYFKIFTRNSINNWCPIEDAHGIEILIPDVYRPDITNDITGEKSTEGPGINFLLPAVVLTQNRTGNEKVWFQWGEPASPATRVKIYYSKEKFPYYDKKTKTIQGGEIIFDGVKSITSFVHRKIPNRETGFYAIIAFDRLGAFANTSNWTLVRHFPLAELDDSGIPLLEAQNVRYHLIDYDRIKISWESPVTITSSFEGWFDDRFYVYAAICDIYGTPLSIDFKDNFKILSSITEINESKIEDVYKLGLDTTNADRIPISEFSIGTDGLITGIVRLKGSTLFAVINSLTIGISAEYAYSNTFKYTLPSSSIKFNNPLNLTLINRDSLYFSTTEYEPPAGCTVGDESGGFGGNKDPRRKRVNGTYIRRKIPFTIRAKYTYKNQAINTARVYCKIFDSTGGPCEISVKDPAGTESKTVLTQTNSFPTIKETSPILDGNGNPTEYTEIISYSDIPILAPYLPQDASAFIRCDANGFIGIKKMNMFFPGTLKVFITAAAPESNNIDIREQFASAYTVDPDFPTDSSKFTKPPNGTIAKWEIKGDGKVKVPFYSIDNVPIANGVYSYFNAGSARNVFFGPANPTVSGTYTITVSTTVRGLFGSASANVEIKGKTGSQFEHFIPDPELPRILAEFPDTVNYVWSDGIDYQKMIISRDPNRATTKYAAKFLECSSGVVLPLPPGTTVNIQAKGYEILTGDVVEVVDVDGTRSLEDSGAIRTTDSAQVVLGASLETYVYFRRNEFIKDKGCRDLTNANCSAYDAPATICYKPYSIGDDLAVILSTKVNFAGKPLNIYGGGHFGNDGRPPCVLVPIEPLYVRYLGLFVDGVPVDKFAVDNITVHHMYFEVRYKDNIIPSGTPFEVFACNLQPDPPLSSEESCRRINAEVGVPSFVYVYTTSELPGEDADPYNEYSLVDVPIGPLPNSNIALGVYIDIAFVDGNSVLIESSSSSSSSSSL